MHNPLTAHPKTRGEGYVRHAITAMSMSFRFFVSSTFLIVHAIFPFLPVPWPFDVSTMLAWLQVLEESRQQISNKGDENERLLALKKGMEEDIKTLKAQNDEMKELLFLLKEYVFCDENDLTEDAKALRTELLKRVKESK